MSERRGAGDVPPPAGAPPSRSPEAPAPREIDEWMYEVTARLAHDMRTPLGAVRMWSHVLRTGREADRAPALDAIEASIAGLGEQMAFLADVTRAVVGRLPVEKQRCELPTLVRQGVETAARELARRIVNVDLQVALADDQPVELEGDPARLRRSFGCLVAAAGAFTAAEETVLARLTTVGGAGASSDRTAVFVVRAPRARVDDAELQHLFTPYHPGKADLGHARPDFGLGPVFARAVVRQHGGDVYGTTETDGGAALVFTVRLPLRREG